MAYLAATVLDAYRAQYSAQQMDKYEHRASRYGCLDAYITDTPNLVNAVELEKAKQAKDHSVTIPVINKKTFTTATTRTCTGATNSNVSAYVTPTWATKMVGFHMVPSQYGNNVVKYQDDFNKKILDMQLHLLAELDTLAYTDLNTDKSVVNNADGNPYTVASDTMGVPYADREQFFNELEQIMATNDLYGNFNVVASPRANALIRHLANQSSANAENFAYQFMGYNFHYSNRCTVAAGDMATVFAMPEGSLGFLTWIDPDARMGLSGGGKEWSTIFLPLLGIEVGLLYQATCGDNSTEAGNGYEASMIENFNFSFDYSFIGAYNSNTATYPGTIFKAGISKT